VCSHDIFAYGGLVIYCFDIDGTICSKVENSNYESAVPHQQRLEKINQLYDEGNKIYFMTARGSVSGKDWTNFTTKQLNTWGFKYHRLIMNQKPHADLFIDDRAENVEVWHKNNIKAVRGVLAGVFDSIHPGYIFMFKEARKHCTHLTVCLHKDPSINGKMQPVMGVKERFEILESIKYVDEVIIYETENDLNNILSTKKYDVRILGTDYISKKITAKGATKEIVFIDRSHGWSATKYKRLVYEKYKQFYGEEK
jgi:cytidyltransferase-like protein